MALNQRKRQQKLERRKSKQKAKRQLVKRQPQGLAAQLELAASCPILHCVTIEDLWEQGIGHVLVSRELPSGDVAFVTFLLDIYCLGVKDVFMDIASRGQYEKRMYGKLADQYDLQTLPPECARKLVEGVVQYAADLGLRPHADYRKAKAIFGNVDPSACTEEFIYGQNGKPLFVAGPNDGPARCDQIIRTLTASCGPDGFHFIMPLHTPPGELLDSDWD